MTDCVVYYEWSSELNERYKCSVCPAEYNSTVERDKHYDKSHVIPRPQCEMCNKEFPNELALEKHLDIKHLDKAEKYTKECPTCHARVQKLSSHIRQKHENIHKLDLYGGICPHCNKLFSNDYKVKRHITQVHENIRPFTCIECEKSFLDKKDLRRHVRGVHFGEKVNKWRRKSSSSESTHIVKKQFNLTEGLLGGPEKYLPTLDTTAGTFGSTGIYFSADSLGPLVQTQPPDVLVAEEEPPEVLVTETDLPGIFITEVVSLEPSDNTEVEAEKDADGSSRSLSKQFDEYTVLVSEDHPPLDERLDEDPGVSDEEPCQNISDISILANYKLSLRNCLVPRDTVETETNQVLTTPGKPSTLSLRRSALESGNHEKSLVSSLELTPPNIEFYREHITPGSVITSRSEQTLLHYTQPDVFSQNSQIFILHNIEENPPGNISTNSEIQIETRSRSDIFKTNNEDSTEETRVEDVDVEEPDELDRFDVLPSQQPDGKEAELDKEETQPLTNISIHDQDSTDYSAGEDLVYSSEEPRDRKTSRRCSEREQNGCRRKYFQHIEHQENQDDFRYKLSRSRVDSTGDIVLELVEKADLHPSKETTAEDSNETSAGDSNDTTTTNQSVLDSQTTKYVTVRWGEDVSSPVILSRYPFPSVDGRLPEILFSETTEETQENSETRSENPGKKAEEPALEDIEGCVDEIQQVDNDGVLMIDDDEDHTGVEYDPLDARTLTAKKIKMNIPDPQESDKNTVVCPEETCSRVFKGKSYKLQYQRHYERVHLQVKKHVCKYCSFRFYGKNDFIRHCESVHRKIKSLCPIDGCNKPVVRLDLHIKQVHSQTNKVSKDKEENTCTECNQVFNRVYDMIRHRETVHLGWKKFKCIECKRGFIDKRDLIRHHDAVHLKIKKQTRRYSCPTCAKKYRLKKDLVEHCSSQSCSKQDTEPS